MNNQDSKTGWPANWMPTVEPKGPFFGVDRTQPSVHFDAPPRPAAEMVPGQDEAAGPHQIGPDGWTSEGEIESGYGLEGGWLKANGYEVLYCYCDDSMGYGHISVDIVLRRGGKLYSVEGSACSCNSLSDDEFDPSEITLDQLRVAAANDWRSGGRLADLVRRLDAGMVAGWKGEGWGE